MEVQQPYIAKNAAPYLGVGDEKQISELALK